MKGWRSLLKKTLLEKIAHRKLTIYQILVELAPGVYTVNTIENECEYAYQRVKSLLHEIHNDLDKLTQSRYQLLDADRRVNITEELISYTSYQQFLLKNSLPYRLILHTLLYPQDKLQDFCEKQFISAASVNRTIKPLQDYLRNYNLKLNVNQLEIKGKESVVRMALYNFLWLNCQGQSLEVVFKDVPAFEDLTNKLLQFMPKQNQYVAKKRIQTILSVSLLRIQSGNYIDIDDDLAGFTEVSAQFLQKCLSIKLPENLLNREFQYIALLCYNGPFYSSTTDPLTQKALTDLKRGSCSLFQLINNFEAFYLQRFVSSADTELLDVLRVNLLCIASNYFIFQQRVPTLFTMVHSTIQEELVLFQDLLLHIRQFLANLANNKEFHWLRTTKADLALTWTHLLLPHYEAFNSQQQLKVGLLLDANYLLTQPLLRFLKQQSFLKVVFHEESLPLDYDYIITTSLFLVPETATCKLFVYDFSVHEKALIELYQLLKEAHLQKNTHLPAEKQWAAL